jgi:MFS family permease
MAKQRKKNTEAEYWKSGWGWFWGISYIAMVVFAFCVPPDILDKYPQAKDFTEFMMGWNVQIRRAGEVSGYANSVQRFVFAVLWCLMPIYWVVFFYQFVRNKSQRITLSRDSWGHFFGTLAIGVVFLWGITGMPNITIQPRTGLLAIGEISRSLIAPVAVFVAGLIVLFIVIAIVMALSGRVIIKGGRNGR